MARINIDRELDEAMRLHAAGQLAKAEPIYRRILAQQPNNADALNNLGAIASAVGKLDVAIKLHLAAIAANPNFPVAYYYLAGAYVNAGRPDLAVPAYRRTLAMQPDAPAMSGLGFALSLMGNTGEAKAVLQRAIAVDPGMIDAHKHLAEALRRSGDVEGSIAANRKALELIERQGGRAPVGVIADIHHALALAFDAQGYLDESLAEYRKVLEIQPENAAVHSALAYALHCHPGYDAAAILQEHVNWERRQVRLDGEQFKPHTNSRDPQRRLRVGYVSPDFRSHVVGRFMVSLIEAHNKEGFEILCYSNTLHPDAITERTKARADVWRETAGLPDERVAEMIRADGVDVLVDLAMHMQGGRLMVFARRPAPVQATYLAYCSTTGLSAMGYRISDVYLDPPGTDGFYTEKTIRLPKTYWCYEAMPQAGQVTESPAAGRGYVTFGCLNNFCKVSDAALRTWGRVMREVPGSRLMLNCPEGSHRERVVRLIGEAGVAAERIDFMTSGPLEVYFSRYGGMDIALDPFPYAGGTTTCDTLWMGVPVVTLRGNTAVGRGGVSILTNVGLQELIAENEDQYVKIAAALARDGERLAALRGSLRQRLQMSPLMDAAGFARDIEGAYRAMWRAWCGGADTTDGDVAAARGA